MAIVNFSLPKTLEKRIFEAIQQKGFTSKAEFFRFAAMYFLDAIDKVFSSEDERFEYLTRMLTQELRTKYRGKKLPPLEEQLAGL
jgi:metal-responsive CopG/Arc/MetJ family transcriptional regulator